MVQVPVLSEVWICSTINLEEKLRRWIGWRIFHLNCVNETSTLYESKQYCSCDDLRKFQQYFDHGIISMKIGGK